jgi:hypothetical protein
VRKAREHARVQTCKGKQQQTGRFKCITTTPHSTTHESTTTPHSTTQGLEGKGHTNAVVDLAVSGDMLVSCALDDTLRTVTSRPFLLAGVGLYPDYKQHRLYPVLVTSNITCTLRF